MLPGTWRSADPLIPVRGEDPHAVVAGVTRPHLSLVQRAPRGPVRSAGMLMPKAARERFTTPPAGTALAPCPGVSPARVLYMSEIRSVTVSVTIVNVKVTSHHCPARPCAGHPRRARSRMAKTWMAGTSPAMTVEEAATICVSRAQRSAIARDARERAFGGALRTRDSRGLRALIHRACESGAPLTRRTASGERGAVTRAWR